MAKVEIMEVHLEAPAACMDELRSFYVDVLGLREIAGADVAVAVGPGQLHWRPSDREPFYHFALLVPGQRFQAAYQWLRDRAELLPHDGSPVVRFEAWNVFAVYFHDPAGSIVELIAHLDIDDPEAATNGPFSPAELLGVSEVGLVLQDRRRAAEALHGQLGIEVWPASDVAALDDPGDLAFLGRTARTLILAPPGRGWLPTARPAEAHPVYVLLAGTSAGGNVQLPGGLQVCAG